MGIPLNRVADGERYLKQLAEAREFLSERLGNAPRLGLVLGSGLGGLEDEFVLETALPYDQIPHFVVPGTGGHPGRLALCVCQGRRLCLLAGRLHAYEGVPPWEVVRAVRVLAAWGVETFLLTNAAGGINPEFRPGDLMLIEDHLNLLGWNPLAGPNLVQLGPRFPDMSEVYSRRLLSLAEASARETGIRTRRGVYAIVPGPSYETPAEVRMLRVLGADAVGMSTVPEAIALAHMDREVLGISCITNFAAGLSAERLDHTEVLKAAGALRGKLSSLLSSFIRRLA